MDWESLENWRTDGNSVINVDVWDSYRTSVLFSACVFQVVATD